MVSKVPETDFIELLGLNVQCIFFTFFPSLLEQSGSNVTLANKDGKIPHNFCAKSPTSNVKHTEMILLNL